MARNLIRGEMKRAIKRKYIYSDVAFITGIGFGITGIIIPPLGIIDNSLLILIGQLLIFTASIIGIKINPKNWK